MRKFCADPNCHTAIPETEIVCSLHKALVELDEISGELQEREPECQCDSLVYACDIHDEPFTPEYPGRDSENPFEW